MVFAKDTKYVISAKTYEFKFGAIAQIITTPIN